MLGLNDILHGDEHLADCHRDCDYFCQCERIDMAEREAWEELETTYEG